MSPNHDEQPWWETIQTKIIVILLAVIVLWFLLEHASNRQAGPARITYARTQVASLVAAISQYEISYSRLPCPQSWSSNGPSVNFTFGTFETSASKVGITNSTTAQTNNSVVIAALLDLTSFANGNPTPNINDALNPQKIVFLNAHMSGDTNSPGIGIDGVFRDPWGNPYIIEFARPATIKVWSLGPDGKADRSQKADQGVNKDNITSW